MSNPRLEWHDSAVQGEVLQSPEVEDWIGSTAETLAGGRRSDTFIGHDRAHGTIR